ncbi:substrate-binding domain-containing protein [Streptomyces sp. NPDC101194]|uniref:substrate-binding domain-containing protein n=1 Tax=Streptomyces sp. NPDC101194 TaxID=3366127 RepID=UPI00380FC6B5
MLALDRLCVIEEVVSVRVGAAAAVPGRPPHRRSARWLFASVPLTTVHQPTDDKGETAARLLLERTGRRSAAPAPVARELPTRLVVRSSTAAAPESE